MKIFLGGTCNNSTWRDNLIPKLEKLHINYFNPIVDDWTIEAQEIEEYEKWNKCDIHLYVITPEQTGFFSFVEIMDSIAQGILTIFAYYKKDWDKGRLKSLEAIQSLLIKRYNNETINVCGFDEDNMINVIVQYLKLLKNEK